MSWNLRCVQSLFIATATVCSIGSVSVSSSALGADWTRFRGPNGSGLSDSSSVPTSWDEKSNMKWSIDLPGPGSSCPIVLGDRVFVTAYSGYGTNVDSPGNPSDLKRHVLCIDRTNGKKVWEKTIDSTVDEDPYTGFISEHGFSSSTPATDGELLFVACGKTGLIALNMKGDEVWRRSLGTKSDPAQWGDGSSPIIYKDLVIINAGNTDHALVALDKKTGEIKWRIENAEWTNNWCTPIVVRANNRDELIFPAPGVIFGMDPLTGKEYWRCDSPIKQTVCASAVANGDVIYIMGGREGNAVAVRCGGSGDVTQTNQLWKSPLRSGIGTPIVVNNKMYWTSGGIAMGVDCENGKELFKERMQRPLSKTDPAAAGGNRRPAGDYASPVAFGENILILLRSGESQVWKASGSYEPVANSAFTNDPGPFNATPAVSNNQIFIRSNVKLYCIGG